MADIFDKLAADIMDDAANTTDKMKALAVASGWTTEDTLTRLAEMFRTIAAAERRKGENRRHDRGN